MKKLILLATAAAIMPRGFMSETVETVLIKGGPDGKGVRVNKSDFDADQASAKPTMTEHKDDAEQSQAGAPILGGFPDGVPHPVAAPSAPDFTGGVEVAKPVIDPTKDAVAPAVPSPNQRLVAKEGRKWFVVDGTGAHLTDDGIDQDGYKSEAEAWNAIMALPH